MIASKLSKFIIQAARWGLCALAAVCVAGAHGLVPGHAGANAAADSAGNVSGFQTGFDGAAGSARRAPASRPSTRQSDRPIRLARDVVYRTIDGDILRMDIARPAVSAGGSHAPYPLVVCIHGGGWQMGWKGTHARTIGLLAHNGYVGAAIDYRLAPQHRFPAQIDDVRVAIAFLRSHAREYDIDPDNIAVLGDSAGGHLALLAGLSADTDQGEHLPIKAIVNYYGMVDFTQWRLTALMQRLVTVGTGSPPDMVLTNLFGTADRTAPIMMAASPVTYIDAKDPPVLTFHGQLDPLIPLHQAQILHAALRKAGVAEQLVTLPAASHGWGGAERDRTDVAMLHFLDEQLCEKKPSPAHAP